MIFTGDEPMSFRDPLPDAVDVAIIGAGVAGVATAWFLAARGLRVLLCEKGRVACEQSSRNWGWIRQQGRDAAELPVMIDAIRQWEQIDATVGEGIGFQRTGVLYLASSEEEMAGYEAWLDVARLYQLDTRLLSRREVDGLVREHSADWVGGLYTASDGCGEPFTAVPAMAAWLHQHRQVAIREQCAVRALDIEGGTVRGIWTEDGPVKADAVLLTGGAWSSRFLRNHDIPLPQLTVRSTVARTAPVDEFYAGGAGDGLFAFRRRQDGGYTIAPGGFSEHYVGIDSVRDARLWMPVLRKSFRSVRLKFGGDLLDRIFPRRHWGRDEVSPFEQTRVLNPAPSPAALAHMRRAVDATLPALRDQPFEESWAGFIDVLPDVVPVMDAVSGYPGLYLGTGFSGHGFGFGPGAGRVLAGKILGEASEFNLDRFRYERFFDGTEMVPGPGL
ncbi:MAG: FAD-binding oxidoreductase [Pseudomonadota bacterium]